MDATPGRLTAWLQRHALLGLLPLSTPLKWLLVALSAAILLAGLARCGLVRLRGPDPASRIPS